MARIAKKEKSDGLYQAILTLRTEEEVYNFFQDLCTVTALRATVTFWSAQGPPAPLSAG